MRVGIRLEGDDRSVGVLGPTTVGAGSATPRQRALIAALALAGAPGADIDELADGVWGGRPPSSARSSLQNQMTRLRRQHGEDLIVCEHARYRLGRSTDVAAFERGAARARSAPVTPGSAEMLSSVLHLWRGTPYADLADSHGAEIERARLARERGRASDLLATFRIQLRDYEACILDLRTDVEDDPYRDRAWELLLVALQRAGRPGEALATYRDYVDRLRSQFGAEPSGPLIEVGRALALGAPLGLPVPDGAHHLVVSAASPTPSTSPRSVAACRHDPVARRCRVRGLR